ncbi:hypothetical protein B7494_g1016 [Chlorociboria aeruginascens]|nr:hypothetical protein B7494_g1016 [Chlorociboria aeruginascens]
MKFLQILVLGATTAVLVSARTVPLREKEIVEQQPIQPSATSTPTLTSTTVLSTTPRSCTFTPSPSQSYPAIPPTAISYITAILATRTRVRQMLTLLPTEQHNIIESLNLGDLLDDARLEGVFVGLVYTRPEKEVERGDDDDDNDEAQSEEREKVMGDARLQCLDAAIEGIRDTMLMEGSLEFDNGRMSFLVYRID